MIFLEARPLRGAAAAVLCGCRSAEQRTRWPCSRRRAGGCRRRRGSFRAVPAPIQREDLRPRHPGPPGRRWRAGQHPHRCQQREGRLGIGQEGGACRYGFPGGSAAQPQPDLRLGCCAAVLRSQPAPAHVSALRSAALQAAATDPLLQPPPPCKQLMCPTALQAAATGPLLEASVRKQLFQMFAAWCEEGSATGARGPGRKQLSQLPVAVCKQGPMLSWHGHMPCSTPGLRRPPGHGHRPVPGPVNADLAPAHALQARTTAPAWPQASPSPWPG